MTGFLQSRRGVAATVALGVLLTAPSLGTGFVADDWFHELQLDHRWLPGMSHGALDLFTFARGNIGDNRQQMDMGLLPWWADANARLSFFRPLASLTHVEDHAAAPKSAVVAHAHNLIWYAFAILAAAWIFRGLLEPRIAALALLLFAVDQCHGPPVGWISNRHELISVALALPAVEWHHRWRSQHWKPGVWLALISLSLGLLAGESAVAVTAYLAAYEVHIDTASLGQRVKSLLPYAAIVVIWRAIYTSLGYGAFHSGLYIDPGRQPVAFLAEFPERSASLIAAQFAGPFSDLVNAYAYLSPHLGLAMFAVALVTIGILSVALWPTFLASPPIRMFTTGMLLAIIPVCATFPADRLLFFAGVGGAALTAAFIATPQTGWRKPVLWGLVGIHLVFSPLLLASRSMSMQTIDKPIERAIQSLPPESVGRTVVIVNAPADPLAGYLPLALASRDAPRAAHFRWLETGSTGLRITRPDNNTLDVFADTGFVEHPTEQLLRSPEFPLHVGETVELSGMTVTVTEVRPDGRPGKARFRFSVPLEHNSLVWLRWDVSHYVRWTVPQVGETARIEPINFLQAALAKE